MNISQDLIQACKAQDRRSQKILYLELLPYLRAVSLRYMYQRDDVKDVLQEAFVLIFKNIDKYDPQKSPFHKWAVKITINATLNYNRKVITNQEEFVIETHDIPQIPKVLKNMSDEASIWLLKQMPLSYFEVFNLNIIDGYDHNEIAKMLNISVALSRKRLSRAREWLKKKFGKNIHLNIDINTSKQHLN